MTRQCVVESLANQICRNIFIGPSPENATDIYHITQILKCNTVLNVSDRKFRIINRPSSVAGYEGSNDSEETALKNEGVQYKQVPMTDGGGFPFKKMVEIIEFANSVHLKDPDNYRLYIHCYGGMSRSAAAVAAIFIGWGHNPEETKRMLERRHSSTLIHPDLWRDLIKNKDRLKGKTVLWNPKREV